MCNNLLSRKYSRHLSLSLHFSNVRSTFSSPLYRGHLPFSAPLLLPRGGFTVKLMNLKLQGPSLAGAHSMALGGTPNKYSPSHLILYSEFCIVYYKRAPKISYKLQSPQNLDPPLLLLLNFYITKLHHANPILSFRIHWSVYISVPDFYSVFQHQTRDFFHFFFLVCLIVFEYRYTKF